MSQGTHVRRPDFERMSTVRLHHPQGGEETCSAILERDPNFLHWNRMSLIGSWDDYVRFLRFQGEGQFQWQLFENPDWPPPGEDQTKHRTSGTGIFQTLGMASGASIGSNSVQKFADISILTYVDTLATSGEKPSVSYSFLQRPRGWYAYPKRPLLLDALSVRGDWRDIPSLKLRFRLLSTGHRRNDARVSQETQLIEIPGVEIESIGHMSPDEFIKQAEDLWFSLRILISFRYQQFVRPLTQAITTPEWIEHTWQTVEVEAKRTSDGQWIMDFLGRVDDFLAQGAASLFTYRDHRELLHAAVWGYVTSFTSFVLEGRLTSRVEAIERLVTVYEKTVSADRDIVSRGRWSAIKSVLKRAIDDLQLEKELAGRIKRSIATPSILTLQERVERMAASYSEEWRQGDRDVLTGLDHMVAARNAVVHGRLVDDVDRLFVETLRAQAIFEKLFLSFVGCPQYHSSGFTCSTISSMERKMVEADEH